MLDLIIHVHVDSWMGFLLGFADEIPENVLMDFSIDFYMDVLVEFLFYYPVLDGLSRGRFDLLPLFYFPM